MRPSLLIQVYEHDTLWLNQDVLNEQIGQKVRFEKAQLLALQDYYEANPGCGYYTPTHKAIYFNQYVGVIQVGDLTIEVLPKTDRHREAKATWQAVLIDMIGICYNVSVVPTQQASLNIRQRRVMDVYLQLFLDEVMKLVHEGLIKKYHREEGNQPALKGKLLIHQHIRHNLVHAERFYVARQAYDRNNLYNAILYQTLAVIQQLSLHPSLNSAAATLLLSFPDCNRITPSPNFFKRLAYDRKTERYRKAIAFAEIILLNYHPDLRSGHQPIIAIMFDMNALWEAYIFYSLHTAARKSNQWLVKEKPTQYFWKQHTGKTARYLEPDIVLESRTDTNKKIVLDTKWKYRKQSSMEDLRQMYAYSHYYGAVQSYLCYPDHLYAGSPIKTIGGNFYKPGTINLQPNISGLAYIDLIANGGLNKEVGKALIEELKNIELIFI